jgi:hypothetical protein
MSNATEPSSSEVNLAIAARVISLSNILAIRERELLEAKGPCSNAKCMLHRAHAGPCDEPRGEDDSE